MKAIFPGTFDPPTLGHLDLIQRAAALFDEFIVAVAVHPEKKPVFSEKERVAMLEKLVQGVRVVAFSGLIVDFAKKESATLLIRGMRSPAMNTLEWGRARENLALGEIETLFLPADPRFAHVSSSLVREVAHFGGSLKGLVPSSIEKEVVSRLCK